MNQTNEREVCQECGGDGSVPLEGGYHACYHCGMSGYEPKNCSRHLHDDGAKR